MVPSIVKIQNINAKKLFPHILGVSGLKIYIYDFNAFWVFLLCILFWDKFSHAPGYPQNCYVAKYDWFLPLLLCAGIIIISHHIWVFSLFFSHFELMMIFPVPLIEDIIHYAFSGFLFSCQNLLEFIYLDLFMDFFSIFLFLNKYYTDILFHDYFSYLDFRWFSHDTCMASLCSPSWSELAIWTRLASISQKSTCLCIQNPGVKSVCHHVQRKFAAKCIFGDNTDERFY